MTNKKKRIIHSPEFKAKTLKLAEKGTVTSQEERLLRYNINKFIEEYDLRDEDG